MRIFSFVTLILFLFSGLTLPGQNTNKPKKIDSEPDTVYRPKVGLVLSGGGAKGFAYIGLLKVLEEVDLKVDYIGGTSIGSIIGGLYAAGYSPDTMEAIINRQNWDNLLNDVVERKYLNYEDKVYGEKYVVSLPIEKKGISMRSSLHQGQMINMLLDRYLSVHYRQKDFSKLPTPFLCIGTDLLTGKAVELNQGYLPFAVRASMSIPGYFSPTQYNGKYLVDGGVINNFPVVNVKNKGIQYVIGGDVQSGLITDPKKLNSITQVLDQVISFSRIKANEEAYKNTDLLIKYNVKYGMMDFNKSDSIIAYGEKVAREHYAELKHLADSLNSIEYVPVKKHDTRPLDSVYVEELVISGIKTVKSSYVYKTFNSFIHKKISVEELEKAILSVYGTNYFDHIFYSLEPNDKGVTLHIDIKEKSTGTIKAAFHYDNDYLGSINLALTSKNLIPSSKIYADMVLGPSPRLRALFLYEIGYHTGFGTNLNMYNFRFDVYDNAAKINQITFSNIAASVFVNKNMKNFYNFKGGFEFERFRFVYEYDTTTIAPKYKEYNNYANFFLSFNADTYNKAVFPSKGFKTTFAVKYVFPLSNGFATEFFSKTLLGYLIYDQAVSFSDRFVFKPGLFLAGTLKTADVPPLQHFFALGGQNPVNYVETFQPFVGLNFFQNYGQYAAVGRLKLQYRLFPKNYVTLKSDFGSISSDINEMAESKNLVFGYGITYSYDSFVGPVELTMMSSNVTKQLQFFINIGFWF